MQGRDLAMTDLSHELLIESRRANWVRLRTLVLLRWAAVLGQSAALVLAEQALGLDLPLGLCFLLVGISATANLAAGLIFPPTTRLTERQVMLMLIFDTAQLMGLVMLTGGLANPFALLLLAPVTISATALPLHATVAVGGTAILFATLAVQVRLPLRLHDGTELAMPPLFVAGFWCAIVIGVLFVSAYARRVSGEIHTMSEALLATQMALAREQKLTDLGGVVAAAAHELGTPLATIKLASSELMDELSDRPELADDARLIREQADRCRDILRSMGRAGKRDSYVARAPLTSVVREAAEPHMARGKAVFVSVAEGLDDTEQPQIDRRPEIVHGLRNLVQNAVDFAASTVSVTVDWSEGRPRVRIADDGRGYPPHLIGRLGDPFLHGRDLARPEYEGMGLGLFIAKTLLRRTGAEIEFMNGGGDALGGAIVTVEWPAQAPPLRRPGDVAVETNRPILS
jgi:two-component system sensor histidine kinase RegB